MTSSARFFANLEFIKNAITSFPSSVAMSRIEHLLSDDALVREFLRLIDDPSWISVLNQKGYFDLPPSSDRTDQGIRYVRWPASEYLVRMSKRAPEQVAEVFASIKCLDPDASVWNDLLDASQEMPAAIAAKLIPSLRYPIENGGAWLHHKDASELCARLAREGEPDAAMQLATALFTMKDRSDAGRPLHRDNYWYKEALKIIIPALIAVRAREFVAFLGGCLRKIIAATEHNENVPNQDYSDIWRPAIEEHEQNHTYSFPGEMVGFVRDAYEKGIDQNSLSFEAALLILGYEMYPVFTRLRLHLINRYGDSRPSLVRGSIMDPAFFDDRRFVHEYAMLVKHRFSILSPEDRQTWLEWADTGMERFTTEEFDDEDSDLKERRRNWWRFRKLVWVQEHLDSERRIFIDQMIETGADREYAFFNSLSKMSRVHDESPINDGEMSSLPFKDAVERIAQWKPEGARFHGPSVQGLASTFGSYVAANVESFSRGAQELIDRPAPFVRAFIGRMTQAIKDNKRIDVLAVLKLCEWVVSRPVDEKTRPDDGEERGENDWRWTLETISEFIEAICKADDNGSPRYKLIAFRDQIGSILTLLTRAPSASIKSKAKEESDPRISDYLSFAINSTRGKATEAALEFAAWIANQIKEDKTVPGGMHSLAEVKSMLAWQIDPANRSIEAFSIIASRLGLLYWIDKDWVRENIDSIFDLKALEQNRDEAWGWAAWNTFLVWVRPHIELFNLLRSQFNYAVEQVSSVNPAANAREQPFYRLGEHLMVLYARGNITLESDNRLLQRFLSAGDVQIRSHAIAFVGRSLRGDDSVPPNIVERFMKLWDWYWAAIGRKDVQEHKKLETFATWFACGIFPTEWALRQLDQITRIVAIPEPDDGIMEQLAKIAKSNLPLATAILDRMIRADTFGQIYQWEEAAKSILAIAVEAAGTVQDMAVQLIDELGRRGYLKFGALLKP